MTNDLIPEDDLNEIKALFRQAMAEKDEEAITILAAEAASAQMYRAVVAEAADALTLGMPEAAEILSAMGPVATEASIPVEMFRDR